ncbi:MAG TPA: MFS transporter [Lacisediminihabitans sp.]|uniref:MFS transporter n=1 Tax=Lacisediminihabitans sp. TaxID=2787631 RepID=UPI002ED9E72B
MTDDPSPAASDPLPALVASNAATPLPRLIGAMMTSIMGAYIALLTPLQLLLTLQLTRISGDGAAASFSVVTGIGALLALVANPLGGRISDRTAARFGRRRTWILTGALSGSLVLATMSFTTQVWQVALIWCVVQTLLNFQQAATSALLSDQVPPDRRGSVSGLLGLATALGPLIGLAAVSLLQNAALQWSIAATGGLLGGVISVLLLRDPQHPRASGEPRLGLAELAKSFWLNPARHPAFGWAWAIRFLITCAYASSTYNAFFLLDRFKVGSARVGGIVLLLSLLSVGLLAITSAVMGFVSDRLHRQKPFVIASGFLAAGGLVLMATAPSVAVVFVATAVSGVATGLFFAVDSAMCVRVLPSSANAGKDLAVINMANTLPQSIVPFIAPALLAVGGFGALYLFLAALGVIGGLFVLRLPEIGREGDPRFALITKPKAVTTAVSSH